MRKKIKLTNNTLTNIRIMAPQLSEEQQNQVFGMMMGIMMSMGKEIDIDKSSEQSCVKSIINEFDFQE